MSAVEPSGAFVSESGNSSEGSGNSSNDSGQSSENSGESSDNSTNQHSKSDSEGTSRNSTEDTSESSDSSESSEKNPVASATVIGLTAAGLGAVFWQAIERGMRFHLYRYAPSEERRAGRGELLSLRGADGGRLGPSA